VVVWALLRSVREQRLAWVRKLALPGVWRAEREGVIYRLMLAGRPTSGTYTETWEADGVARQETGHWALRGNDLELTPRGGRPERYALRLFEPGRIGLHGPGRERRVYEREPANVVPLLRQQTH